MATAKESKIKSKNIQPEEVFTVSTEMVLYLRDDSNSWTFDNEDDSMDKYYEVVSELENDLYDSGDYKNYYGYDDNMDEDQVWNFIHEAVDESIFWNKEKYILKKEYSREEGTWVFTFGSQMWTGITDDIIKYNGKSRMDFINLENDEIRTLVADYKLGPKYKELFKWVSVESYNSDCCELYYIRDGKALVFNYDDESRIEWFFYEHEQVNKKGGPTSLPGLLFWTEALQRAEAFKKENRVKGRVQGR